MTTQSKCCHCPTPGKDRRAMLRENRFCSCDCHGVVVIPKLDGAKR